MGVGCRRCARRGDRDLRRARRARSDRSPAARGCRNDGAGWLRAARRRLAHAAGPLRRDGARCDARPRVRTLPRARGRASRIARRRAISIGSSGVAVADAGMGDGARGRRRSRQAGVMGLAGAWGPMLTLLGALPNYPPLALVAALALVLAAAAHFLALARIIFGKLAAEWEKSPLLEPFGGQLPGSHRARVDEHRAARDARGAARRLAGAALHDDDGHGARSDERGEPTGPRSDRAALPRDPLARAISTSSQRAWRQRACGCGGLGGCGGLLGGGRRDDEGGGEHRRALRGAGAVVLAERSGLAAGRHRQRAVVGRA